MACRDTYKTTACNNFITGNTIVTENVVNENVDRLLFGVDSYYPANDLLQNNINQFEWVVRNKIYPNFYGRNINGENCLTCEEITFLHDKGCKIAAIYSSKDEKQTEEQGCQIAKIICTRAKSLCIPFGVAVFLEVCDCEKITGSFIKGYTEAMITEGYTPAFKVNTDAKYNFDREFSSCANYCKEPLKKCLIWAIEPTVKEYNGITTSHLIHPDKWSPYAPSSIRRNEIAIWQYGRECHPIYNDQDKKTTFNVNLVRNEDVIIKKMF